MQPKKEEEKKTEPVLVQYIKHRTIDQNKNFAMVFIGSVGSGKSFASLKLAEELDPTFDINRVAFKPIEFMNIVNGLVARAEKGETIKGLVVIWDELGASHSMREFMTLSNRLINFFFQTSRHLNLVVLMTVPVFGFIDSATRKLLHCTAEMESINHREKTATAKIKMLQTNVMSSKTYPKYLRYKKGNKMLVSKKMKFGLPSEKP